MEENIRKEITNTSDMIQGCKNRMCVTKDENELSRLYQSLSLYAADLFRMNLRRIRCSQD